MKLVAVGRGPLEFEPVAATDHLRSKDLDRPVVGAVEKGPSHCDPLHVYARRARRDAGTETLFQLVAQATGRSRTELKEFFLVRVTHLLVKRTVSHSQRIRQLAERLSHLHGAEEWAVIERPIVGP